MYIKNTEPFENPKYGIVTLIYKNELKNRTPFIYGDSFCDVMYLCTFSYFSHLLFHIPKYDLRTVINILNDVENKPLAIYVECQIYGFVNLSRDVSKIIVPRHI